MSPRAPPASWPALQCARSCGARARAGASDPDPPLPPQGHLHDRYGQLVSVYTKLLLTKISFHLKVVSSGGRGPLCHEPGLRGQALSCPGLGPGPTSAPGPSRPLLGQHQGRWRLRRPGLSSPLPSLSSQNRSGPEPTWAAAEWGCPLRSTPSFPRASRWQTRCWKRQRGLTSTTCESQKAGGLAPPPLPPLPCVFLRPPRPVPTVLHARSPLSGALVPTVSGSGAAGPVPRRGG